MTAQARMVAEAVEWTSRCPHGGEGSWRAERRDSEWPDSSSRSTAVVDCDCPERAA